MKTTLKIFFAVAFVFSALTATLSASPVKLFTIDNSTAFSLGTVTIVNDDGDRTTVDVPGPGTFSTSVAGKVERVVINHQSLRRGDQLNSITLESGIVVQVSMTGTGIVVIDEQIISGLKKPHSH